MTDNQNQQFQSFIYAAGGLLLVHLVTFVIARGSMSLVGGGYLIWACAVVPVFAVALAVFMAMGNFWHWRYAAVFTLISVTASFFQLLTIRGASPAV